ncbi:MULTISPECIES: 50S ribosomal protein L25/general stress protein Ctc [Myxococcus]|uniref:Large ribosomal subunit protein bL25 n=1 Tax=Myxococcus xanthus TaxID=34 RepID=A0AAE6G324_MYXXA|nr:MULTISPECIES: 50S ribosomal protein L25/general stress protein Ctc [Myxococcus]QDE70053.1 50S ribosomal protein L25/general stress protein Ctc [Myxococcus xanthus]QDE77332.1 50S ribosomal protein L25/general stress protein Ctc [Myxococcus xanthus]QDE84719.1 50S ribosomal protein L25/general stress protein Ctc [Myxococcus xanthus]QDE98882.1 50S ribosomal protein L25/general stress protein Ctc [Myxococcus xanthus]QDF06545.1 50S ribosomal protein L25/general stress protein Ctc [Myxococcus xant
MSVNTSTLEAKPREGSGKGVARRLRAQGLIPAVVYGKHLEKPVHISVDPKAVRQAINTPHKFNTLIQIKVEGGDRQVLLKDYQMEPVTRAILHADFLDVRANEQVKVNVPLVLSGRAQGVADGGLLTQARREIEVWSLPGAIPERIEVDVTPMKIAEVLHINDVKLPEGVSVKTNVNYTLAVISAPEAVEAGPAAAAAAAAPAKDAKAAPAKDAKAPAKK